MSRPFDFPATVLELTRIRQYGQCAHCGQDMADVWEAGHHVVPNQSGTPGDPDHAWLRGEDNCVILCDDCHTAAHAHGHFRTGATPYPEWYTNSHGPNEALHRAWVARVNALIQNL